MAATNISITLSDADEDMDSIKIKDEDERLQPILAWTTDDVANWIKELGFPYYQDCFRCNEVNGRKLILADASRLCKLGIKDYKHIKFIAKEIRKLLRITEPKWEVSVADIPRDIKELYLEQKSRTGFLADRLNLKEFIVETENVKWQPPLSNLIQIMTHNRQNNL